MKSSRIVKGSAIYKMLKYGPLPEGNFQYLIKNGKVTIYARWLLSAADLGLSFLELCILARLISVLQIHRRFGGGEHVYRRYHLDDEFVCSKSNFSRQTVWNALTRLVNKGYVITGHRHWMIHTTDETEEMIKDTLGDDLEHLIIYVEDEVGVDPSSFDYTSANNATTIKNKPMVIDQSDSVSDAEIQH